MARKVIIKGAPKGSNVIIKKAIKKPLPSRSRGGRYVLK